MFRIREAHLAAFQPLTDRLLGEDIVEHLHENHPEIVDPIPDDTLRAMVAYGVGRARSHNLTWAYSITFFVALMFEIAPNFDEHRPVQRVLQDSSVPPDERMDLLDERISEKEWQEAKELGDQNVWPCAARKRT